LRLYPVHVPLGSCRSFENSHDCLRPAHDRHGKNPVALDHTEADAFSWQFYVFHDGALGAGTKYQTNANDGSRLDAAGWSEAKDL
jgi:hypothetical protein